MHIIPHAPVLPLVLVGVLLFAPRGNAQEPAPPPRSVPASPAPVAPVAPPPGVNPPLPINLPTALELAGVRPLDVALASERIRIADAQLQRAQVLWLPTIQMGTDYFRHDGRIQDVAGNVFGTSKSTFMIGAAPIAIFAVTDAIYGPLAARQDLRARQALHQAAQNDSLLAVAEAYFNVQQARGELAGAADASRRAEDLVRRTEHLAAGLVPPVEAVRAKAEAARRRQAVHSARERWQTASAELARLLRLDPAALVEPLEPPHLQVTLVPVSSLVDDLIPVGLTNRPELAAQQAFVQATLQRLRQERMRPLMPSLLLRGGSTNPGGTLAGGYFGGGVNGNLANFNARSDFDVQVLWELQNLGLGNRARVNERRAENRGAALELLRVQDRVAAEIVQALAQVQSAAARVGDAELGLKYAVESANQNLAGLGQTKSAGNLLVLVIRPQEVVASVQALSQAYADYYGAIGDYDRAQFRLYRAMGQPAQALKCGGNLTAPAPGFVSDEPVHSPAPLPEKPD